MVILNLLALTIFSFNNLLSGHSATPHRAPRPVPSPNPSPRVVVSRPPANITTNQSLFTALNNYRIKQGLNALAWDQTLANYAQGRADYYLQRNSMDNHEGFKQLTSTSAGFYRLGFRSLGENSSSGYNTTPVNLIEKIYAASPHHQANQLNPNWTHAGIGTSGSFTDLVFGGNKI